MKKKTSSGAGPREFWVNSDEYQFSIMPLLMCALVFTDVILMLRQDDYTTRLWPASIASFILVLAAILGVICVYRYEAHFGKPPRRKNVWTAFSDIRNSIYYYYTRATILLPFIVFFVARSEQSMFCAAWLLLIYDSGFFLMRIVYAVKLHRRIQRAKNVGRASRF